MKTCTKCGETKPFEAFSKHKLGRDGLRPSCKTCCLSEERQRYASNPSSKDKVLRKSRDWMQRQPEAYRDARLKRVINFGGARSKEKKRAVAGRCRERLTDAYVRNAMGITKDAPAATPALIEAKREHLRLVRLLKEKK